MALSPSQIGFTNGTTAATTVASPSISWNSGDTIAVVVQTSGGNNQTFSVPTTTGTGLTFTQQQLHNANGTSTTGCGQGIWTSVATATSSGTITGHLSTSDVMSIYVMTIPSATGIGSSTVGTSANLTASVTPVQADSLFIWAVGDWAAAAVQTLTPTATSHSSASPGPTASPDSGTVAPTQYTFYYQDLDDQTSAGAVSYGIGGSGTGPFTIGVLEIKGSAAAPTIPNVAMPPMIGS